MNEIQVATSRDRVGLLEAASRLVYARGDIELWHFHFLQLILDTVEVTNVDATCDI